MTTPSQVRIAAALRYYADCHDSHHAAMRIPSLFEQAVGCAASYAEAKAETKFTLRSWHLKPGVRQGSVTSKVLEILRGSPGRWFEHHTLMVMTGASRGAISWAVHYLQTQKLIRSIPSVKRRPQGGGKALLRYQATTEN